jgi:Lecithin:cholesterol acyltransferase
VRHGRAALPVDKRQPPGVSPYSIVYLQRAKAEPTTLQVVITSHSWGEAVVRNFFWWVERRSRGWVEKHVAAFVNISGTVLGVPKVPCCCRRRLRVV